MTPGSGLSSRVHGGPDAMGVPLHDFSTNSNACGPCPHALAAINGADAAHYPDASYANLRQQLAGFHGVHAGRIVLAASASEFIFRITAVVAQRSPTAQVWVPAQAYGDYAQAAQAHRLRMAMQAADAELLWSCDPSSPLGKADDGLPGLVGMGNSAAMPAQVVLDRAYEPLRLEGALAISPAQLQTIWQLWTPNKALGLTGVRAAYAIAPEGEAAQDDVLALERLCPSWPIGAHGVAMLQSWAQPSTQAWLAESLITLREWKARQLAMCHDLGWTCEHSVSGFFCATPKLPEPLSLDRALVVLRAQGIKLRDTTSFGLPGSVRISVQPPAAQDALHNAWLLMTKGN